MLHRAGAERAKRRLAIARLEGLALVVLPALPMLSTTLPNSLVVLVGQRLCRFCSSAESPRWLV